MSSVLGLAGIVLFWIYSPESLRLLGNGAGSGITAGIVFLWIFGGAALIAWYSLYKTSDPASLNETREVKEDAAKYGVLSAVGFAGIIGTCLFASTGMLVTAGFTFNEVFFYRFPPFAFAFLILALILLTQMILGRRMMFVQSALILVSILCLAFLTIIGLIPSDTAQRAPPAAGFFSVGQFLPLVLVFIGFDQTFQFARGFRGNKAVTLILPAAMLLLSGWMFASSLHVDPAKLSVSSIPHMKAAAGIFGQPGRLIMGLAVISGSAAAVSGLLWLSICYLRRFSGAKVPRFFNHLTAVSLSLVIAALMFFGVAGTAELEVYIRVSLSVWLIYSGSSLLCRLTDGGFSKPSVGRLLQLGGFAVAVVFSVSGILLIFAIDERAVAAIFLTAALVLSALCIISFKMMRTFKTSPGRNDAKKEVST